MDDDIAARQLFGPSLIPIFRFVAFVQQIAERILGKGANSGRQVGSHRCGSLETTIDD